MDRPIVPSVGGCMRGAFMRREGVASISARWVIIAGIKLREHLYVSIAIRLAKSR